MKKEKVTIKNYGFLEWLIYQYDNDTWIYFFVRLFLNCLIAFITALIVTYDIISSNPCS